MTAPPAPRLIAGKKFLQALADAGIIRTEDHIRRVIIDAAVDTAVSIYVERYGDERLLSVAIGKHGGYVIKYVPREPDEESRRE